MKVSLKPASRVRLAKAYLSFLALGFQDATCSYFPFSLAPCPPLPFPTDLGSCAFPLSIHTRVSPLLSSLFTANWKPRSSLVSDLVWLPCRLNTVI